MSTMTTEQAREFRAAHDADARTLSHQTKTQLVRIAAHRGVYVYSTRHSCGPSKDELISVLLDARYPVARLNESIHVLWHKPGETWSACEHCHPHQGSTCECPLRATVTAVSGLNGSA